MVFDHIEKQKKDYTDKYVVVDETRPELRRFRGQTGVVRTVNMSGRALVEFDAHENIGWYDIDLDFLKVIDKPLPKEEPASKKKPAAKKPAAATAAPAAGKMSVEEMLAAARSGGAPAAAKPAQTAAAAADPTKMSVADMLAAARGEKTAPTGAAAAPAEPTPTATAEPDTSKKDPAKMSVAEMLAAARAEKSGEAAPPVTAETVTPDEAAAATDTEPSADVASSESAPAGPLPTDTAEIVAWCRAHDAP